MLYAFDEFELDDARLELRRSGIRIEIQPKVLDLLGYLLRNCDRVVPRDELFRRVWPDLHVGQSSLNRAVRAARLALGDSAEGQRLILTVPRRGYRFVVRVEVRGSAPGGDPGPARTSLLVGRQRDVAHLRSLIDEVCRGERRVAFVTGEAGIGKTALVEDVLRAAERDGRVLVARGCCAPTQGVREAYRPVLDAIEQLCRSPEHGSRAIELLRRHAPTWCAQIPWLEQAGTTGGARRVGRGVPIERMPREFLSFGGALAAETPIALLLEDLHWADPSSVDLVNEIARQRDPASLLLLGTFRYGDARAANQELAAEVEILLLRGSGEEIRLGPLDEAQVSAYLRARFGADTELASRLAATLHRRSSGNPLFLTALVESWITAGLLQKQNGGWVQSQPLEALARGVPDTLRAVLERQADVLFARDKPLLEAASALGVEFSAAAAAAGADRPPEEAERTLADLARRGEGLRALGTQAWPDGTIACRFAFTHALVPEVLYEQIAPTERVVTHRRIAERLAAAYEGHDTAIAADLARHFECAGAALHAVYYHARAAEVVSGRFGYREAVSHVSRALELLATEPPGRSRDQQELGLRMTLIPPLIATRGQAAPEVEAVFSRATELAAGLGETPEILPVLSGLCSYHLARSELHAAGQFAERCLALAERTGDVPHKITANLLTGIVSFYRGELRDARGRLLEVLELYDVERHAALLVFDDLDPGVVALAYLGWNEWLLGRTDLGRARAGDAVALARQVARPHSEALALCFAASLCASAGDRPGAREFAREAVRVAGEFGFVQWLALARALGSWARLGEEEGCDGIDEMRTALADYRAGGGRLSLGFFLGLVAAESLRRGRVDEGLAALAEARTSVEGGGERYFEAELRRLEGQLLLSRGAFAATEQAERCFDLACGVAREQHSLALELRASLSLAKLWRARGEETRALALLGHVHARMPDGADQGDVHAAEAQRTPR